MLKSLKNMRNSLEITWTIIISNISVLMHSFLRLFFILLVNKFLILTTCDILELQLLFC